MPRDPSGNVTLYSPGNPVVTNTTISSAWANNTLNDIATWGTDSLSRSGLGGMLAPFKLVDGSVSTPGFAFQSESNTGIYRFGAFDARFSVGATDVFKWTNLGPTAILGFTALAGITSTGAASSAGLTSTGGAGNGDGVDGTATGTGAGVKGVSSSTSGSVGVVGQGANAQLGLFAFSSAANVDVARVDGYVDLSQATNPATSTGFSKRLTPNNLIKAWGHVAINGSDVTSISGGFNIASTSYANGSFSLTVNLTTGMSSVNGNAVIITNQSNSNAVNSVTLPSWGSTTSFDIVSSATMRGREIAFIVLGAQ